MRKQIAVLLTLLGLGGSALAQSPNNARMLSTPNAQTGTSYTFAAADTTRVTTFNNALATAVSLPNGAVQGFGPGTMLSVVNLGAGTVTITCSSCTINGAATLVLAQNQGADIYGGSGTPAVNYVSVASPGGSSFATLPGNNVFTGNESHSGTETFTGSLLCKNFEAIRCEDQFTPLTPAARVSAALTDCASNPCTVLVPANEANTELLGNLTTSPGTNQLIWTMNNAGYGGTQGTNWLLCDFSGTALSSPCRNGEGPQMFQFGRTWNNSPTNGNEGGVVWMRFSGVSANTLANPLVSLGIVAEANGLTQSNGTPAPVIGIDAVASVAGNSTTITNMRIFSTDPGGLQNAGTGNTITNLYGYYAQKPSALPAGLAITNYYNGYFDEPTASGITNSYSLWSNGRTVISDSTLSPSLPLLRVRGVLSGGSQRTTDVLQVTDAANADAVVFAVDKSGLTKANTIISTGTAAALTGTGSCATITTQTGGSWAGTAKCTGTTGASTFIITPGTTAPNGWSCWASDLTTAANILRQSAVGATSCTIAGTVNANDVLTFGAVAY